NLFPPLDNHELTIRRRSCSDPTLLNNSEMAAEGPSDLPVPDLGTMKELCQPSLNGWGGPIAPIAIQETNFRLKNDMIQQVWNSCQFQGNGDPPVPDLRTIEELCQPSLNGRGGPIIAIAIQAMSFGLKNDMIQQVQNSCQFHGLPVDDTNKHLDKFLHVTAKLTHAVSQQTSAVTTAMTAILKQFQATPPLASVKAVEEICDNIRGYVTAAAVNYNQGNFGYRPPVVPLSELEKIKRVNEANMKAMQTQINNVKNELRSEMKNLIQASMSNQTNELKNMMASFFQMNTASTFGSGSLPSNTIANPKGELKANTTRSSIVLDGTSVPIPPLFINPEEDERVDETLTDQDLAEYTIKGNSVYRPLGMDNQIRTPGFAQPNVKNNQKWFSQPQGYNRGNNFNPE
nr:reverse transcriptase domain-containing protein [Tanacetum cinerariifolium]